ncbi:MAG: beta-eliminating lyase-related protein, partial [Balneolaceae bacterium]|nr:beta-eliminating lyase-related protein [Balneolaceae bacterium]
NKGGGVCYSREEIMELSNLADKHGIFLHLDGARIWNAITKTGIKPEFFGSVADTISICFSKGLGAPVGSMMLSSSDHIKKARRFRQMWGGGMRQVGLLAAAADYAVENHFPLMADDHRRARRFAEAVAENPAFEIDLSSVETNIVIFDVKNETAEAVLKSFADSGVGMIPFGPKTIRATFHFQVGDEELEKVIEVVSNYK